MNIFSQFLFRLLRRAQDIWNAFSTQSDTRFLWLCTHALLKRQGVYRVRARFESLNHSGYLSNTHSSIKDSDSPPQTPFISWLCNEGAVIYLRPALIF